MTIDDIIALPNQENSIAIILEFIKIASKDEIYQAYIIILKIYYASNNPKFEDYYQILLNDYTFFQTEFVNEFIKITAHYLLDNNRFDEAYQLIHVMSNNHYLLSYFYYLTDNYIDSYRELILSGQKARYLPFLLLDEYKYDQALIEAKEYDLNDYYFIEAVSYYKQGGLLDFKNVNNPTDELKIRMAIEEIDAFGKDINNIWDKYLDLLDNVTLSLKRKFLKTYYYHIKNLKEKENINLEINKINNVLDQRFVYKGNNPTTLNKLDTLYKSFEKTEQLIKKINEIDFNLQYREIFRLSMIELEKVVPFTQSIIVFKEKDLFLIDYKKQLAFDKHKQLDILFKSPLEEIIFNNKELFCCEDEKLKNYRDIITLKSLADQNIRSCLGFPIQKDNEVIGGLLFYSNKDNLFIDFNYEIIHFFYKFFIEKTLMKDKRDHDVAIFTSYEFVFNNLDMPIRYIYNGESIFNEFGKKFDQDNKLLDFYETNLVYQTSLGQLRQGLIDHFDFEFTINKRYYYEKVKSVQLNKSKMIISIIRDVTEEKKALINQQNIAEKNYVTNMPNRLVFEREIIDYLDDKFTLFAISINRFKMFNEVYGYEAGDIAIRSLGKIIQSINERFRVFHLEGDKFLILYDYVNDARTIKKIALDLIKELEYKMYEKNYRFNFTFAVGSLRYPVHTKDTRPSKLIKYTISALSKAAYNIMESTYFDFNVLENKNDLFEQILMTQLSEAIDNNHLVIKYQQLIDTKENRVVTNEAMIYCGGFNVARKYLLEVAEKRLLITKLDNYLIKSVLHEMNSFKVKTKKLLKVSLLINYQTILKENFVNLLEQEINANGINKNLLSLEIDGDIIDIEKTKTIIRDIRKLGVSVILTKVSDILKIECDYLKIYKSNEYFDDNRSIESLKSLNKLVNSLKMELVLGDVNDLSILNLIKGYGFRYISGTCYGKEKTMGELLRKIGGNNGSSD